MAKRPKYLATPADSVICPDCGSRDITLLATANVVDAPAFYLCRCGFIGQLGVGSVRRGLARTGERCGDEATG